MFRYHTIISPRSTGNWRNAGLLTTSSRHPGSFQKPEEPLLNSKRYKDLCEKESAKRWKRLVSKSPLCLSAVTVPQHKNLPTLKLRRFSKELVKNKGLEHTFIINKPVCTEDFYRKVLKSSKLHPVAQRVRHCRPCREHWNKLSK